MAEKPDQKDQMPSSDDNILTRHKHIAESIEMIRVKKDQLLQTLRGLSKSENPDKALMAKLIEAFDMMTAQENQFLGVLKNIVDIHNQATNDVAAEMQIEKTEAKTTEKPQTEEAKNEKSEGKEEDDENDEALIRETLKELEMVSLKALAAAELNEKLVETLQRHKKSRTSMLELRRNKTEELKTAATAAVAEVKKAKQEVFANKAEIQKKQREAEELRKAALKAGIQVGTGGEKHKAEVNAALTAITNDVERIPPIPVVEDPKDIKEPEDPLEARRRQIRENVRKERERREHVNQVIKEKLLAMEARKERMKEIRRLLAENQAAATSILTETKKKIEAAIPEGEIGKEQLNGKAEGGDLKPNETRDDSKPKETKVGKKSIVTEGAIVHAVPARAEIPVPTEKAPPIPADAEDNEYDEEEEQTRRDIEETFRNAEANLANLTLLRQRLEEMKERGGELTQEDAELIGQLDLDDVANGRVYYDEDEEKRDTPSKQHNGISPLRIITPPPLQPSASHTIPTTTMKVDNAHDAMPCADECADRLKHMEQMLEEQTSMLAELVARNQPSNSRLATVAVVPSEVLLDLLRSSDPALLQALAASLLQLANRLPTPHLQRILTAICEGKSHQVGTSDYVQDSTPPTIAQVRVAPDGVNDAESSVKMNPRVHQQAIMSMMLSVRAVLEQFQILEEETEKRVREVVVAAATALFLNVPRTLIETQLGPLIADVLASYGGESTAAVFDELSAEIVRVLDSELDFFHLINTLNCIPDP